MPQIPEDIPEKDRKLVQELLEQKPPEFTELTQTQYEAFENSVLGEENHLLIAETGNGKTFVAEAVIKKAVSRGETVAYLVPSRSLVGEKYNTFASWLPDSTDIREGRGYTDADVIVSTFESFFEASIRGYTGRFDHVVLDDFHEIYSTHRGPNIEKAISSAINDGKSILGISATVGNPHTVARWMEARLTISTEERAVPIAENPVETDSNSTYAEQITNIIRQDEDKGPFLVFNDTTRNAEARARGVANRHSFNMGDDVDFRSQVEEVITTEMNDSHEELADMMERGVAYHHAKMERGLKKLIEKYTERGVLSCVFSTTTLSYGFDSPIKSVIVADLKRWDGGRTFIGNYEYVQWVGRAGRDATAYDQAYAFPMYGDDEAAEKFQFGTPVENKDLEDVESHLSGETPLRWLVLELVNYGWSTDEEVIDFVSSTLFWSETVTQVPSHVQSSEESQPSSEVVDKITHTLGWLTDHGLLNKPIGQPQRDVERYDATDLGAALVDYQHSNWFGNSVVDVLELTEWLAECGDSLTPEALVQKLADTYIYCEASAEVPVDNRPLREKMSSNGLFGEGASTAVISCWFWCSGLSLTAIEEAIDSDDLSSFPSTASNIATAVDSITHLYEPFEMPAEPKWLTTFSDQLDAGVPGPDMHLLENASQFGRVLYNDLEERLNSYNTDWALGPEYFVIERLSSLLTDANDQQFKEVISGTYGIGPQISQNLLEVVKAWDPEADTFDVPIAESARDRRDATDVTRFHNHAIDSREDEESGGSSAADAHHETNIDAPETDTQETQTTKLSDF
jgi:replicative superfamily II helicase